MSTTHEKSLEAMGQLARGAVHTRMSLNEIYINTENNVREGYDEDMAELQASIEQVGGLLQALHVVEVDASEYTEGKDYALVAGYRRSFALMELGEEDPAWLEDVPVCVITPASEGGVKIAQLIENIQRVDLKPLEKASGFKAAMDDQIAQLTQKEVANLCGISETSVSQHLRLLDLPRPILDMLEDGEITFSHCRTIMYQVPQDQWLESAKIAKTLTIGDFNRRVESRYGAKGGEGGEGGDAVEASTQRAATMIRANKLKTIYVPFFHQQVKEAKTAAERAAWEIRLDAVKWIMQDSTTKLADLVKPFEEKIEAAQEAEGAAKKSANAEKKFLRTWMAKLRDLRKSMPADGETKRTLTEDLALVQEGVTAILADAAQVKALGFTLESVDVFMETLAKEYAESLVKKEQAKKERAEKKAKEKAEEKKDTPDDTPDKEDGDGTASAPGDDADTE